MNSAPRTLQAVWKWLPVFRCVAETQSVTQAAHFLNVTPPAVSRTIALIEDALGRELFERRRRQMVLNSAGASLLGTLRDVDGLLSGTLERITNRASMDVLRLGTVGHYGRAFLVPVVERLVLAFPRLQTSIVHLDPEDALAQLQGGTLDLFLALNVAVGEPLIAEPVADLAMGVYVGVGHGLWSKGKLEARDLPHHGFVVQRPSGLTRSVWPLETKRLVTLETDSHAVALEACLRGTHLLVMERIIGSALETEGRLRELHSDFLSPGRLVVCRNARATQYDALTKVTSILHSTLEEVIAAC